MEENEEEKEIESEEVDGRSIARVQESFAKIDTGKAMIIIFMLAAAMCCLLGVYAGYTFAQNEANEQLTEFFSNNICVKAKQQLDYNNVLTIPKEITNEIR